jgi:hypothetical protein
MSPFRPMTQFDPSRPARPRSTERETFEWSPEWRDNFERNKREAGLGIVSWDGLLLDGWAPIEGDPFSHHPLMHGCLVFQDLGGIGP